MKTFVKQHLRKKRRGVTIVKRHSRKVRSKHRQGPPIPPPPKIDIDWEEFTNKRRQEKAFGRIIKKADIESEQDPLVKEQALQARIQNTLPILYLKFKGSKHFTDYNKAMKNYGTVMDDNGQPVMWGKPIKVSEQITVNAPEPDIEANKEEAKRLIPQLNKYPFIVNPIVEAKVVYANVKTDKDTLPESFAKQLEELMKKNSILAESAKELNLVPEDKFEVRKEKEIRRLKHLEVIR